MEVIRTIHPVGQGAFYSEEFICDNDEKALVVYDCGSNSKQSYLKSEISSFFQQRKEIDILFISHFDSDHVNGIKHILSQKVKIKNVVIPLIDKKDEWFYICMDNKSKIVRQAIQNPRSFFQTNNVIRVSPINEGREETSDPLIIGDDEEMPPKISSGRPLSLKKADKDWVYIPFNFDEDKRRKIFLNELKQQPFIKNPHDIETLLKDANFIEINHKKINKVYNASFPGNGASNNCSLIVYSGMADEGNRHSMLVPYVCGRPFSCRAEIYKQCNCEGCLYLGDTDLNQVNDKNVEILTELKQHLSKYIKIISTIQLPHHGSLKNFNADLFNIFTRCNIFFASFGTSNTYGHPSNDVIGQILLKNYHFCKVSELRDSCLTEIIRM